MARIRANCPRCGEVELRPDDMELHVMGADREPQAYLFDCPQCCDEVLRPADNRIAGLLHHAGVPTVHVPDAVTELHSVGHPEDPRPGPAFTMDDLLDFHDLLAREDWFESLTQAR